MNRLKLFLCFFVLLSWVTKSWAQTGEPRSEIAVGFNAGMVLNTVMFTPTIKLTQLPGPTLGATLRVTSERYFKTYCALQVELNYARLGWREYVLDHQSEPLPDTYERQLSYVQLPFMARLAWGKEQKGFMGYFLAGPQVGYLMAEKSIRSDDWTLDANGNPDRPNNMYLHYAMPIDKKFDYGITAGIGLELNSRAGHFMVDARYYYGLADIYNNSKKDVFARSNHSTISVRLTYLFNVRD